MAERAGVRVFVRTFSANADETSVVTQSLIRASPGANRRNRTRIALVVASTVSAATTEDVSR